MTAGQYALFVLLLIGGAIAIVMIKSFKVENDDAGRTDVVVSGHEIEGRAVRCAQRIGIRLELSPTAVTELQKGLLYTHRQWLGDSNPTSVGEEFARAALERLSKLELIDSSMRKDEETIKKIGQIVGESLAMDEEYETRPMAGAELQQATTA